MPSCVGPAQSPTSANCPLRGGGVPRMLRLFCLWKVSGQAGRPRGSVRTSPGFASGWVKTFRTSRSALGTSLTRDTSGRPMERGHDPPGKTRKRASLPENPAAPQAVGSRVTAPAHGEKLGTLALP